MSHSIKEETHLEEPTAHRHPHTSKACHTNALNFSLTNAHAQQDSEKDKRNAHTHPSFHRTTKLQSKSENNSIIGPRGLLSTIVEAEEEEEEEEGNNLRHTRPQLQRSRKFKFRSNNHDCIMGIYDLVRKVDKEAGRYGKSGSDPHDSKENPAHGELSHTLARHGDSLQHINKQRSWTCGHVSDSRSQAGHIPIQERGGKGGNGLQNRHYNKCLSYNGHNGEGGEPPFAARSSAKKKTKLRLSLKNHHISWCPLLLLLIQPLKRLRDHYVKCCFSLASAGDLSNLVGEGHVVGPLFQDLFAHSSKDG